VTEIELEREVRRLLTAYGLRYAFHVPDSRGMAAGLPDWIIIGAGRVLWRELKDPYRGLSQAQWDVGDRLMEAGQDWAVWRPADYASGRVENEIRAAAGV